MFYVTISLYFGQSCYLAYNLMLTKNRKFGIKFATRPEAEAWTKFNQRSFDRALSILEV
jgi:hypothetical protein